MAQPTSEKLTTEETLMLRGEIRSVRKAEWGVIIALLINVITASFGVGVYFNTITEQGRRIESLEKDRNVDRQSLAALEKLLVRIDSNVATLKERADEDRRVIYQRRGL